MIEERKSEEFEDDLKNWNIYFDLKEQGFFGDKTLFVKFVINRKEYPLLKEDIENLKQDLKELGKFRIIKQGREFLEYKSS